MRRWAVGVAFLVLFSSGRSVVAGPRQVLLIQSFDQAQLTFGAFADNLRAELTRRLRGPVTFVQFSLEPPGVRHPSLHAVAQLRSMFSPDRRPDLIVTIGGPAAVFVQKHHQHLFPGTPTLLAALDQRFVDRARLPPEAAVVSVMHDVRRVVKDLLQLLPDTRHLFVVLGTSELEESWRAEIEHQLTGFQNRLTLEWSIDFSFPEMLKRSAALPPHSAIMFVLFNVDVLGAAYSEERVLTELRAVASAPVFGVQSAQLGHGIVGGALMALDDLSHNASDVAVRLLEGEQPSRLTIAPQPPGRPIFDWRELRRWNVPASRLPATSIVLFRESTMWERHHWAILGAVSLLLMQGVVILVLITSRTKRRRVEQLMLGDGSSSGYVGSAIEITDLRAARSALSSLSRRLMQAQDEERARLAGELDDDIAQRMALMTLQLDMLNQKLAEDSPEAHADVHRLCVEAHDLAVDVQSISRRLHSSKLQFFGIASAAAGLCDEISAQHGTPIDFRSEGVPADLPHDSALALFRVLEEALSNAVKHADASQIAVALAGIGSTVQLQIVDDGRGFDPTQALRRGSVGLVSMHERMTLVGGQLALISQPSAGTTVRAVVSGKP